MVGIPKTPLDRYQMLLERDVARILRLSCIPVYLYIHEDVESSISFVSIPKTLFPVCLRSVDQLPTHLALGPRARVTSQARSGRVGSGLIEFSHQLS